MIMKILLVEDDEAISYIYKRQLDLANMPTDVCKNGTAALGAMNEKQYDVVLLDIMLPDMNGIDILKKMKADEKTEKLTVIFLTNMGQDSVIKEGFRLGIDGYLIKSAFTPDQLIGEIKNIIEQKKSPQAPPSDTT